MTYLNIHIILLTRILILDQDTIIPVSDLNVNPAHAPPPWIFESSSRFVSLKQVQHFMIHFMIIRMFSTVALQAPTPSISWNIFYDGWDKIISSCKWYVWTIFHIFSAAFSRQNAAKCFKFSKQCINLNGNETQFCQHIRKHKTVILRIFF